MSFLFIVLALLMVSRTEATVAVSPIRSSTLSPDAFSLPVKTNLPPADIDWQGTAVGRNLRSPDGLARDEKTGDIYVSEENAATIVRIRPDGTRVVLFDHSTSVFDREGISRRPVEGLRSPEGIALDRKGHLYVVEDVPGGRLISFTLSPKSANPRPYGTVVPIPLQNNGIAWESVAVGPAGELLLAGSTVESFASDVRREGLFRGTVLYRDDQDEWWMLLNDVMTSYSAACFSPDGKVAFFACEVSGDVGCLDLRSHTIRTFHAQKIFHSPEGLCSLPDGSVLVAEEGGKIYRFDPIADTVQQWYDNGATIESLQWDEAAQQLLVTDDEQGALWSLGLTDGWEWPPPPFRAPRILFQVQSTPVEMIPEKCPSYLARVLKVGGYDPHQKDSDVSFQDFARQFCLVAIDAEAMLLSEGKAVEDPIKRIQFVIVAPYMMGIQSGQLLWSSSGFAAIKESGEILKTQLVPRQIFAGDLLERSCTPVGGQTVAVPMPFSARVNADGVASVNFMGMGVTPDFYLILNTLEPDNSYMVVIQAGSVQQYALHLPPYSDRSHWVVSLIRTEPDIWKALSFDP